MSLFALLFSRFQAHRSAAPVFSGSLRSVTKGRHSVRVSGQLCLSLTAGVGGFFSGAYPVSGASSANPLGFLQTHRSATPVVLWSQRSALETHRFMRVSGRSCFSLAVRAGGFLSGAQPWVSEGIPRSAFQNHVEKTALSSTAWANPALNLAPFSRWTLRDKAAQRRLALRWASSNHVICA